MKRTSTRTDGATVTIIGSGDAFNSGGRGNACYLVEDRRGAFCVDFGPTALMNLKKRGFDLDRLDGVFLTHLHGDHFGGLHLLFIDCQYRAWRKRPLFIAGPRGTEKKVEAWYKLAYGKAGSRREFETRYIELEPNQSALIAGRRVRTFPAAHMEPKDGALHLRFRLDGVTLGFSGDTDWNEDLIPLAKGADLLVCECTNEEAGPDGHLGWDELRPKLTSLAARKIVLTHLGERMRQLSTRLQAPRVVFADDQAVFRVTPAARTASTPSRQLHAARKRRLAQSNAHRTGRGQSD